jgi:amino acid transporter, AAT family
MTQQKAAHVEFNYLFGLLNMVVTFLIVWLLWYLFMHPNGIMGLYTPMYGFSLVVTFVAVILMMIDIADFYPFPEKGTAESHFIRGVYLTITAIALMLFVYYMFFWGFIGKFGIAYFSPQSIIASGGTGAELFPARENASTAIVYFLTSFIWMTLFWKTGFEQWPWHNSGRGTIAWSRFCSVLFLSVIIFSVLFHPHVTNLFYPAQDKAGVFPWWADFAGTGSAFFSLGIILSSIFWLISFNLLWEGQPFNQYRKVKQGAVLKGVTVFICSGILGMLTVYIATRIMNVTWGEAFVGGSYTDAPSFRYLHSAELAGFFILAIYILKHYFNNFPNFGHIWVRGISRTALAIIGGLGIHTFYYSSFAGIVFGRLPGFGQPEDTPIVWLFMFVSVIIIQMEFFEGWPLRKTSEESRWIKTEENLQVTSSRI